MRKFLITFMMFVLSMATCFAATDISENYITAEGIGAANQSVYAGYKAAEADALRNLLKQVGEIQVDSVTTVEQGMLISDYIKTEIHGKVKHAQKVDSFIGKDNLYHYIVQMPVYGSSGLMKSVTPIIESRPENSVPAVYTPSNMYIPTGNYTGLIIDCRGLNIDTGLAPTIVTSDNKIIYNYANVAYDTIINRGMVGYAKTTEGTRAGTKPLIVKATGVSNFINPIVTNLDADIIISENRLTKFFDAGNVVFLK